MIEKVKQLRVPTFVLRQVVAPVVVSVVLAMSAFGCSGENGVGGRTFNSKLSLRVYVVREADGMGEEIGRTPSAKPVVIPRCASWFVGSVDPMDMRAIAREIASKGIPGLWLGGAEDEDLAHLKGLTGLRELWLSGTQITDAGLAHLKGLTGLRELGLSYTKVTDAGVNSLRKALPGVNIHRR